MLSRPCMLNLLAISVVLATSVGVEAGNCFRYDLDQNNQYIWEQICGNLVWRGCGGGNGTTTCNATHLGECDERTWLVPGPDASAEVATVRETNLGEEGREIQEEELTYQCSTGGGCDCLYIVYYWSCRFGAEDSQHTEDFYPLDPDEQCFGGCCGGCGCCF